MLSAVLNRWLNKVPKNKPARRAGYRPEILVLEERITPTDYYWAGAAGANWSAAGSWKLASGAAGAVPGPADTAIFGNFLAAKDNRSFFSLFRSLHLAARLFTITAE